MSLVVVTHRFRVPGCMVLLWLSSRFQFDLSETRISSIFSHKKKGYVLELNIFCTFSWIKFSTQQLNMNSFYNRHKNNFIKLMKMWTNVSITLTFLINEEDPLFIVESKFHPRPPRLFNFEKFSTLDMNFYVVKSFFHPPL